MGGAPFCRAGAEPILYDRPPTDSAKEPKKKELLGNFHRVGQTYTQQTVETFDHDFGTQDTEN